MDKYKKGQDLTLVADETLWRMFVAAHKKMALIERVEQFTGKMKAAEEAWSEHQGKELKLIERIEQLVAELKAAVAARLDGIVQEAHRRD